MRQCYSREPIAVTGIGLLCPLGATRDEVWSGVVAGRCGIREITGVDITGLSFRLGGQVDVIDVERLPADLREPWVDRASQMIALVAREAVAHAAVCLREFDPRRVGIALGSCQMRFGRLRPFFDQADVTGWAGADPLPLLGSVVTTPADVLAAHLGVRGPKYVVSNACAAGASAIGMAVDALRWGRADVMLAGGVDLLEQYSLAGFDSVEAIDSRPCSPYSRSGGINVGEGAAVLVLERVRSVRARGASVLAHVAGYGLSSDAHHATAPDPRGAGAVRAMEAALRQAGLDAVDVDYVNGHGTGTPANDSAEKAAMRTLFGERAPLVPVSSTKSQIGHTLGAAGAIEVAVCVQAVAEQVFPPTIHVEEPASAPGDLDIVPNRGRAGRVGTALSTSFAFGGANCAVVVTDHVREALPPVAADRVVVTGRGVVSSAGCADAMLDALREGRRCIAPPRSYSVEGCTCTLAGEITDRAHLRRIDPAYLRKLDQLGRLTVAATAMAMDDARLRLPSAQRHRAGLVFGTFTGPAETMGTMRRTVSYEGLDKVSARIFPNTVLNAAAGHACLALQLKGPTCTIAGGFVAGLTAIAYAADLVRQGEADVMLAASADELTREVHGSFDRLGLLTPEQPRPYDLAARGMVPAAAGCVLALESLPHALQRGAAPRAELIGHALTSDAQSAVGIDPSGAAWAECLRLALDDAGVSPGDVGCVFGDGRGNPVVDRAELRALGTVFSGSDARLATLSPLLGHAMGTQAPLGVVAALETCASGFAPDLAGIEAPVAEAGGLRFGGPVDPGREIMVVTCCAPGGTYAALVLRRFVP